MPDSMFSKIPTELVETMAEYLDDRDLIEFRLACRKLDAQTVRIVGERFFSILQTSLIGSDIQKLEQLACGRFAKYVKKILVHDDSEKIKEAQRRQQKEQADEKRRPSSRVWPLDELGDIDMDKIGFATLRNILRTCKLCPDELTIRDFNDRTPGWCSITQPCAIMARYILLNSKLAVASLRMGTRGGTYRVEAIACLVREHEGRDLGLTMLKKARVKLGCDEVSLYWTEQLLLHAPILEDLFLSTRCGSAKLCRTNTLLLSLAPCFQLKRLHLDGTRMAAIPILNLLSNSKDTLISLSFRDVRLQPDTEASNWTHLLEKLAKLYINITHWKVELYMTGKPFFERIFFPGFGKNCLEEEDRSGLKIVHNGEEGRAATIGYNGPNAARVLYTMASYAQSR
ncbi:hypothetical protein CFE70_009403 [Pyrenophora teres f. teres 0-1]|uniref:F-box domain-containing protein n=2 Tax=Pyrenophora teres f. teres TaxID=97479 RepID=E3RZ55_PYRTT|nr:hypothetical protein PTT_14907 [Pyrenophora teres f. teres 0-1]KAE8857821.1 hypothetical protein PTNB73_09069 [Pyrenophora teres f. teres]CAE7211210.1 hypothetical protein PTTW11_10140 [Pyrenophora teres f. teres]